MKTENTSATAQTGIPAQGQKSEPVAWSLIFDDWYGINPETTYKTREKAELYAKTCGKNPSPKVVALYVALPAEIQTDNATVDAIIDDIIDDMAEAWLAKKWHKAFREDCARLVAAARSCSPAANDYLQGLIGRISDYFHVNAKPTDDLAQGYMRELDALIVSWPSQPETDK